MDKTCDRHLECQENKRELFTKNGYQIFTCEKCDHCFAEISDTTNHVSKIYSDTYFFDGKAGYPNYFEEKDLLLAAGKRYAQLIRNYTLPGKLLDVGCAAGFITKGFANDGWMCRGIEPNNTMASYGRSELGIDIETMSLENYKSDEQFDLICLIEVIGHFYDLDKALRNISSLVKEGGLVLVESWNKNSAIARLQGKNWHEYSPPSVLHWFTDKSISKVFENFGLQLLAKGHPKKYIKIKHALSLLDETLPNFIFKKKLLNMTNLLVGQHTLRYPLHDLKWYLFKKNRITYEPSI